MSELNTSSAPSGLRRRATLFDESVSSTKILRVTAMLTAVWLIFGLLNSAVFAAPNDSMTYWESLWQDYVCSAVYWITWGPVTVIAFLLSRRFPITRPALWRSVAKHLGFCIVLAEFQILFFTYVSPLTLMAVYGYPYADVLATYSVPRFLLGWRLLYGQLIYWGIVGAEHAIRHYRREQEQSVKTLRLEAQAAQARLQALANRLHPHFLFNSFHTIVSLIEIHEYEKARDMAVGLSDLLRRTLSNENSHMISLREEFDFATAYLNLEQTRFSERLSFTAQLDPTVESAIVPRLLLQPLVENAVRYGAEVSEVQCHIYLRGTEDGGRVRVEIENDGPRVASEVGRPAGLGIGQHLTIERLSATFGNDYSFEYLPRDSGGARVVVVMPNRSSAMESTHESK